MVQSALQATLVTLSPHPSMVYSTSPPSTLHTYPVSSSPPVATNPALVFSPQQNTDPVCLENTSLLWSSILFSCSSIKASSWSIPPGNSTNSSSSSLLSSTISSCTLYPFPSPLSPRQFHLHTSHRHHQILVYQGTQVGYFHSPFGGSSSEMQKRIKFKELSIRVWLL